MTYNDRAPSKQEADRDVFHDTLDDLADLGGWLELFEGEWGAFHSDDAEEGRRRYRRFQEAIDTVLSLREEV